MSSFYIVLEFVFRLAALLFLLRFLLQASQADFYNPLSQAVVKSTDVVCKPLRYVMPSYRNFDFASLFVAWLICVGAVATVYFLRANELPPVLGVIWAGVIRTLIVLTDFYMFSIFIVVIASFLVQGTYHPVLGLFNQLLEPIVGPIRRILPTFGPIDFSPMVVLLIIFVVQDLLQRSAL